jgi:hypothetical protein
MVELRRLELLTSCLPGKRSNQLSYSPNHTDYTALPLLFATIKHMNDDTLDDITSKLEAADPDNPQSLTTGTPSDDAQTTQPAQNYAFFTPTEAGIRATDPNDIPAAPRPQPGMTFTPTGGSVSEVHHQLNTDANTVIEPDNSGTESA